MLGQRPARMHPVTFAGCFECLHLGGAPGGFDTAAVFRVPSSRRAGRRGRTAAARSPARTSPGPTRCRASVISPRMSRLPTLHRSGPGCDPHYGLARVGIASLRIDFAGLGDRRNPASASAGGVTHTFAVSREGDLAGAVDAMQRLSYRRSVVNGLSSSAYHAFQGCSRGRSRLRPPARQSALVQTGPRQAWPCEHGAAWRVGPLAPRCLDAAEVLRRRLRDHGARTALRTWRHGTPWRAGCFRGDCARSRPRPDWDRDAAGGRRSNDRPPATSGACCPPIGCATA